MQETARIVDQLQRAYDGDAWYGPRLSGLLADVTPGEAAARPLAGAHTIWEIVLHVSAWVETVRLRLVSGRGDQPAEGDWPAVEATATDEASWMSLRATLEERVETLAHDVAALDDNRLAEGIGRATGPGVTVYVTLHGLVQHLAYHAGQIAMLKRALRSA